ncbi:unnamed protein product [Pedinophyceae sp. YPF-701]|nr:unnamed protein product [Pedinophyceae sp. YPF-701]
MKLMFEVYDRDQDQFIGFDDLLSMLQVATTKRVAAGELERVCRALIEVFDADKDGRLSLGEFSNLVKASSELRAPS